MSSDCITGPSFISSEGSVLLRLFTMMILLLLATSEISLGTGIAFKPAVSYPVGTAPMAVAVGDFNGDGKLDLAVANSGNPSAGDDGGISVLLGNGDGTFQAARDVSAGKNPGSVAADDLNGDGRVDLVITNGDGGVGQVGVLLGNGDGTFQPVVDYAAGNVPISIGIGDFNGDLRPDVAVANAADGTVSVLSGNGDGSFQNHVDYTTGGGPRSIVVADLNADGKADLVVACPTTRGPALIANVAILMGNGDGTFQSSVLYDNHGPFGPTDIAVGDFNGDGNPDVIVDVFRPTCCPPVVYHKLNLMLGNGDGTFALVTDVVAGSGHLSAADFDGDGKLDIARNGLVFLPGNGDGTFQTPVNFPITAAGALSSRDFNGDKAPDLMIVDQTNNLVAVVLNVGTDFSLSASPANPATIGLGQSATSTVSLSLLSAFDNPVSLSCSVQPAQAGAPTCSLNPSSVVFDGKGNGTAQLTITAGVSTASLIQPSIRQDSPPERSPWLPIAGCAFAGAGLARNSSSRRKLFGFLVGSVLFAGLIFQIACGSSGGRRPQEYSVKVTATSGSTQRTSTTTVTVQ